MGKSTRLNKLEEALTPRQSVLLWRHEAHRHRGLRGYARDLLERSEDEFPLVRLLEQVTRAARDSMKGQPRDAADRAVRLAYQDAFFLQCLHQNLNIRVLEDHRHWSMVIALLAERLLGLQQQRDSWLTGRMRAMQLSFQMPYPLDVKTSGTVDRAIRNHVSTWIDLEEGGDIEGWVLEHFIQNGAAELPERSYGYRDGKFGPTVDENNEDQVRSCFQDQAEFERFRAGEDYRYGLSDVTDEDFMARHAQLQSALQELVTSGQVMAGAAVRLETVPMSFLRNAPLIDETWIDRKAVELAEWGPC